MTLTMSTELINLSPSSRFGLAESIRYLLSQDTPKRLSTLERELSSRLLSRFQTNDILVRDVFQAALVFGVKGETSVARWAAKHLLEDLLKVALFYVDRNGALLLTPTAAVRLFEAIKGETSLNKA